MSSILHKYFGEMGIDISWYKKYSYEKTTTSDSKSESLVYGIFSKIVFIA